MGLKETKFLKFCREIKEECVKIARNGSSEFLNKNPLGQISIKVDKDLESYLISNIKKKYSNSSLLTEESGLLKFSEKPKQIIIIDPLDGSDNFRRGIPIYSLGMCYAPYGGSLKDVEESYVINLFTGEEFYSKTGEGVYQNGSKTRASDVKNLENATIGFDLNVDIGGWEVPDELKKSLLNTRDHRRFGSNLLGNCYTATGALDAYIDIRGIYSIVHASGLSMLRENCIVTDEKGHELNSELRLNEKVKLVAAGNKKLHKKLLSLIKKHYYV